MSARRTTLHRPRRAQRNSARKHKDLLLAHSSRTASPGRNWGRHFPEQCLCHCKAALGGRTDCSKPWRRSALKCPRSRLANTHACTYAWAQGPTCSGTRRRCKQQPTCTNPPHSSPMAHRQCRAGDLAILAHPPLRSETCSSETLGYPRPHAVGKLGKVGLVWVRLRTSSLGGGIGGCCILTSSTHFPRSVLPPRSALPRMLGGQRWEWLSGHQWIQF